MEKISNESIKGKDQQAVNALRKEYESARRELEKLDAELPPESIESPASHVEFEGNKATLGNLREQRNLLQAQDRTLLEENQLDKLNRKISTLEKQQAAYQEKGAVEGETKPEVPAKSEKRELPVEVKTETKSSFSFLRSLFKAAEGILKFFNIKAQYSKETNKTQRQTASSDIGTFTQEGKLEREVQQKALYNEILAQGKMFQGVPQKYSSFFNGLQGWVRAEVVQMKDHKNELDKVAHLKDSNKAEEKEKYQDMEDRFKRTETIAVGFREHTRKTLEDMKADINELRKIGMEKAYPEEFKKLVELQQGLENICNQSGEFRAPYVETFMNWRNQYPLISPQEFLRRIDSEITLTLFSEKLDIRTDIDLTPLKNTFRLLASVDSANQTFIEGCDKAAENMAQMIAKNAIVLKGLNPGQRLDDKQSTAMKKEITALRAQISAREIPEGDYKNAYTVAKEKMLRALHAYENRLESVQPQNKPA
ncbi:MAG: hypothetical protein LLG04_14970 [Parachlamydia sp.]|nr:hypothetical protein [Parachlamydia sp.]